VKHTLAAGRWPIGGGGGGRGEDVGSVSLVNCNSPIRIVLDLEELGQGGRPYSGDSRQALVKLSL